MDKQSPMIPQTSPAVLQLLRLPALVSFRERIMAIIAQIVGTIGMQQSTMETMPRTIEAIPSPLEEVGVVCAVYWFGAGVVGA